MIKNKDRFWSYLKTAAAAFKKVFSRPSYAVFALSAAAIVFLLSVWLQNFKLIAAVWANNRISIAAKINLMVNLTAGIKTSFSAFSAVYIVIISILFGLNIAMLVYYLKVKREVLGKKEAIASIVGAASGILGIGCAVCGSVILTAILPLIGGGVLLALLPLGGGEFAVLGIIMLLFSISVVSKKIIQPFIC